MNRVKATSFADASDLRNFNRSRKAGKTEVQALSDGDNGMGAWGLSTVKGTGPCVALSPSVAGFARNRLVRVFYGDRHVDAEVRDIAPEGVIDLNPDACEELGLQPPVRVMVDWIWL